MSVSTIKLAVAAIAAAAVALCAAPAALANTAKSSNWAGYAVHRSGVKFKSVSGRWKLQEATCASGMRTFSSTWVGLGGFSGKVNALEQIGSETDCNAHGKMVASVWYELVPAPSHTIRMKVDPGDTISAAVKVIDKKVTVSLHDLTRDKSFTRTVTVPKVDVSSADWIVEAPSECRGSSFCRVLPLANFGSATFTAARAVSTTGNTGSISNSRWGTTEITLAGSAHHFVDNPNGAIGAQASVSPLSANGSSFTVTYASSTPTTTPPPVTQDPSPPVSQSPVPTATGLYRAR
jgi:hypothetical protein